MIPGNRSPRKTCSIASANQANTRRPLAGLVTSGGPQKRAGRKTGTALRPTSRNPRQGLLRPRVFRHRGIRPGRAEQGDHRELGPRRRDMARRHREASLCTERLPRGIRARQRPFGYRSGPPGGPSAGAGPVSRRGLGLDSAAVPELGAGGNGRIAASAELPYLYSWRRHRVLVPGPA
jgi:hypothetical protein